MIQTVIRILEEVAKKRAGEAKPRPARKSAKRGRPRKNPASE